MPYPRATLYRLRTEYSVEVTVHVPSASFADYELGTVSPQEDVFTTTAAFLPARTGLLRVDGETEYIRYSGTLLFFEHASLPAAITRSCTFDLAGRVYRVARGESITNLYECDALEVLITAAEQVGG